jgi:biofilm PGA synthesis N-glycosyltransferase PgaC
MSEVVEIIFWGSLFIIFYTYAGYPLVVFLLVKIKNAFQEQQNFPTMGLLPVTLVIAAYNEEKIIREKIRNCLELDYPEESLKLIFVTDGSTDNTCNIIKEYGNIILLHHPERKGKPAAVNRAMLQVSTPVVIFTDANTFLNSSSIKNIVIHFADPRVGGVSGEKRVKENNASGGQGEGWYWRYESLLKKLDSDLKTTVGAAGELFSMRTSLYSPLPDNTIIEDFVQSLLLCRKGYVVKYEPEAYAEEMGSLSRHDEMERKTRISAGAFQAMGMLGKLFNIFRYPVVAFLFISHRILRWTICPLSLVALLISSLYLSLDKGTVLYQVAAILQVILYLAAAAGWWLARQNRQIKVLYVLFYFVLMNFCVFTGFFRFLGNKQSVLWQKAER